MNHCSAPEGEPPGGDVIARPGGSAPTSIVPVAVPLPRHAPPVVVSCWEYATPTDAAGNESLTIWNGGLACAQRLQSARLETAANRPVTVRARQPYVRIKSPLQAYPIPPSYDRKGSMSDQAMLARISKMASRRQH